MTQSKDKIFAQAIKSLEGLFVEEHKVRRAASLIDDLKSLYASSSKGTPTGKVKGPSSYELPALKGGQGVDFYAFSDGACRGNPGPGAWGVVIQNQRGVVVGEWAQFVADTTNNRMELLGAIKALEFILERGGRRVCLGSDSKYVLGGLESWLSSWKKRGWKKADKKEPENLDLWQQIDALKAKFEAFHCLWIKGHAGHPQNERCDELANRALDEAGY